MKIQIENFQIIRNLTLDIPAGITMIIGRSSSGKTAIFRAFDTLLYPDKTRKHLITQGQESMSVSLQDGDQEFKLTMGQKQSKQYFKNNERITVEEARKQMQDMFSFGSVKVNQMSYDINVWKQMEKPFLLQTTPQNLFDFFATMSKQKPLQNLEIKIKEDLKKRKNDLTKAQGVVEFVKDNLRELHLHDEKYANVSVWIQLVQSGNAQYKKIKSITSIIRDIRDMSSKVQESKNRLSKLDSAISSLSKKIDVVEPHILMINKMRSNVEWLVETKNLKVKKERDLDLVYKWLLIYKEKNFDSLFSLLDEKDKVNKRLVEKMMNLVYLKKQVSTILEKVKYYESMVKSLDLKMGDFKICPICLKPMEDNHESGH